MTCFVQVDVEAFVIRWSERHFINIQALGRLRCHAKLTSVRGVECSESERQEVSFLSTAESSTKKTAEKPSGVLQWFRVTIGRFQILVGGKRHSRGRSHEIGPDSAELMISFNDAGGVTRVLELRMPSDSVRSFLTGVTLVRRACLKGMSPAYSRWASMCMAATSYQGACGFLRHSELTALLRRANGSAQINLADALGAVERLEAELELPAFMRRGTPDDVGSNPQCLVSARRITWMLFLLSTDSEILRELFDRYAKDRCMGMSEWLDFVSEEQMPHLDEHEVGELRRLSCSLAESSPVPIGRGTFAAAMRQFESETSYSRGLDYLQFRSLILSPANDTCKPSHHFEDTLDQGQPFTHYWCASSHNSYLIGDQLTGLSKADAYRRQLLQVRGTTYRSTISFVNYAK